MNNDHLKTWKPSIVQLSNALDLMDPSTCRPEADMSRAFQYLRALEPTFQARVAPWMRDTFGPNISADRVERNDRFLEEALELVQAGGMTRNRVLTLVDYTYGRPVGHLPQEVGGVMVTLAALCLAYGVDMHLEGETELARISTPEMMAKIRAKQASKPKGSALPVAVESPVWRIDEFWSSANPGRSVLMLATKPEELIVWPTRHDFIRTVAKSSDAAPQLRAALERMLKMHDMMFKQTNVGASFFGGETLQEMNEAPIQARRALSQPASVDEDGERFRFMLAACVPGSAECAAMDQATSEVAPDDTRAQTEILVETLDRAREIMKGGVA